MRRKAFFNYRYNSNFISLSFSFENPMFDFMVDIAGEASKAENVENESVKKENLEKESHETGKRHSSYASLNSTPYLFPFVDILQRFSKHLPNFRA